MSLSSVVYRGNKQEFRSCPHSAMGASITVGFMSIVNKELSKLCVLLSGALALVVCKAHILSWVFAKRQACCKAFSYPWLGLTSFVSGHKPFLINVEAPVATIEKPRSIVGSQDLLKGVKVVTRHQPRCNSPGLSWAHKTRRRPCWAWSMSIVG